jgi:hypothetical protein
LDKAALQEYQRVLMNDVDIVLLAAEQVEHYSKSSQEDGLAKLWLSIHAFLGYNCERIEDVMAPEFCEGPCGS